MDGLYKIGAVSKITGINIPTLRVWENKFQIVEPNRINGTQRGYTKNDLDKLCIVKALVETGDSISTLSGLDIIELESRLDSNSKQKKNSAPNEPKLNITAIVVGTMVPNFEVYLYNRFKNHDLKSLPAPNFFCASLIIVSLHARLKAFFKSC